MNGVSNITEKILDEARAYAASQQEAAQELARSIREEYEKRAKELYDSEMEKADRQRENILQKAESRREMEARNQMLAAKRRCIDKAFDQALQKLAGMSNEQKIASTVGMVIQYQTTDAQLIFNQADREAIGKAVVDTVNSVYSRVELKDALSSFKGLVERVKKLVAGEPVRYRVSLSEVTGNFAGGFILREGDIDSNCTYEVLVKNVREQLEGEVSAILFD